MGSVLFIYTFMLQAIKIKLYPTEDQKIYINKLVGTTRFVYNKCLSFKSLEYGLWNNSTDSTAISTSVETNIKLNSLNQTYISQIYTNK